MGRSEEYESIVLQTYDVGEADRFCVILTKERGRLAARARGVRKPGSRMGGSILPLQHTSMTIREGSAGFFISDSKVISDNCTMLPLQTFLHAQQCIETLLCILEDDHPVPEVFALLDTFLAACRANQIHTSLPFTIRLLHELGVLPGSSSHQIYAHLQASDRHVLEQSLQTEWTTVTSDVACPALQGLCTRIVEDQSRRPLRSPGIARAMSV